MISQDDQVGFNPEDAETHGEAVQLRESLWCPLASILQITVLCAFDQHGRSHFLFTVVVCFMKFMTQNNNHEELKTIRERNRKKRHNFNAIEKI